MWNRVEVGLSSHRKTKRLMGRAALDARNAVGALVLLWEAVRLQAPDGNLDGWDVEELGGVMGFSEADAPRVVDALVAAGYLERTTVGFLVHDWDVHNGQHVKDAQRKKSERQAKKSADVHGRPPDGDATNLTDEPDKTDEREAPGVASQRAGTLTRDQVFETAGATDAEAALVDAYCGLQAGDESEGANATRLALVSSQDWRESVSTVLLSADEAAQVQEAANTGAGVVLGLIGAIADSKRMPASPGKAAPVKKAGPTRVHVGAVFELTKSLPKADQVVALQLTQRLFNAGVHNGEILKAVAQHYIDHRGNIRNPWAYYSPGGEGFDWIQTRWSASMSVAEGEAFKALDKNWLKAAGQ